MLQITGRTEPNWFEAVGKRINGEKCDVSVRRGQ